MRINPDELHIKDSNYFEHVYAPASKKREKGARFVKVIALPLSGLATVGHDLHRSRRGLINNFFSKKSVVELSPMIHEKQSKLMQRFEEAHTNDTVLQLDDAFAALTADLITQYSWGACFGYLDHENFNNDIRQALNEIASFVHVVKFFPVLGTILTVMPRWLIGKIRPGSTAIIDMQDLVAQQSKAEKSTTRASRQTIFDALSDPSVPPAERSPRRLQDEGMSVVLAGTETTARSVALAAFHLYHEDNKPLLLKLRNELRSLMPAPTTEVSWTQLEQLPFLVRHLALYWTKANITERNTTYFGVEWCCK